MSASNRILRRWGWGVDPLGYESSWANRDLGQQVAQQAGLLADYSLARDQLLSNWPTWYQPDNDVAWPALPRPGIAPVDAQAALWPEQPGQERAVWPSWFQPDPDSWTPFTPAVAFDPAPMAGVWPEPLAADQLRPTAPATWFQPDTEAWTPIPGLTVATPPELAGVWIEQPGQERSVELRWFQLPDLTAEPTFKFPAAPVVLSTRWLGPNRWFVTYTVPPGITSAAVPPAFTLYLFAWLDGATWAAGFSTDPSGQSVIFWNQPADQQPHTIQFAVLAGSSGFPENFIPDPAIALTQPWMAGFLLEGVVDGYASALSASEPIPYPVPPATSFEPLLPWHSASYADGPDPSWFEGSVGPIEPLAAPVFDPAPMAGAYQGADDSEQLAHVERRFVPELEVRDVLTAPLQRLYFRARVFGEDLFGGEDARTLRETPGDGLNVITANTVNSPSEAPFVDAGQFVTFYSPYLKAGFLTGPLTFNIWADESNAGADVAIEARLKLIAGQDTIFAFEADGQREVDVSGRTLYRFSGAVPSIFVGSPNRVPITEGMRLEITLVTTAPAGLSQVTGFTASVGFDGTTPDVDGDSWVGFPQPIELLPFTEIETRTAAWLEAPVIYPPTPWFAPEAAFDAPFTPTPAFDPAPIVPALAADALAIAAAWGQPVELDGWTPTPPFAPTVASVAEQAALWPEQPGQDRFLQPVWYQPEDAAEGLTPPAPAFDPTATTAALMFDPDIRLRVDFTPDAIEASFDGGLAAWLHLVWGGCPPTGPSATPAVLIDALTGDPFVHLDGPFIARAD